MFLREVVTNARSGAPVRYAQLLESYRDEAGKSRHRVVMSLGRVDRIDKDKLRGLVAALSRYLETGEVPAGACVGEVREFGLPYLADAVWRRFSLPDVVRRLLRKRRFEIGVERA